MDNLFASRPSYTTPDRQPLALLRRFPSLCFYAPLLAILGKAGAKARWGHFDGTDWARSSETVVQALERVGCRLEIEGMNHYQQLDGPCVFVGNHMSTLETFVLPCLIQFWKPVTFVVKSSLMKYPVFDKVLASRNPIVVERVNPREDFTTVIEGGMERLANGTSIIVFPQSTRAEVFDRSHFNTIGIKLAKKAGVPVVPLALKTHAWGNGQLLRDFGPIRPERTIHIRFAKPLQIAATGKDEHQQICEFIEKSLEEWN